MEGREYLPQKDMLMDSVADGIVHLLPLGAKKHFIERIQVGSGSTEGTLNYKLLPHDDGTRMPSGVAKDVVPRKAYERVTQPEVDLMQPEVDLMQPGKNIMKPDVDAMTTGMGHHTLNSTAATTVQSQEKGPRADGLSRKILQMIHMSSPTAKQQLDNHVGICVLCKQGVNAATNTVLGKLMRYQGKSDVVVLHEQCARWGLKDAVNEEDIKNLLAKAQMRACNSCGSPGASIQCQHGGCGTWHHLHCAHKSAETVLDMHRRLLVCTRHARPFEDGSPKKSLSGSLIDDGAHDSDEEFAPGMERLHKSAMKSKKPRSKRLFHSDSRTSRGTASRGGHDGIQRPRTDWQRREHNTWVKIVPPWWCEQKTIHFANKVFRELFDSARDVILEVEGKSWNCYVLAETRNDLRLQYTMRGDFQNLWDEIGIQAGDVLTFVKLKSDGYPIIQLEKHEQGQGFEDLFVPKEKSRIRSISQPASKRPRRDPKIKQSSDVVSNIGDLDTLAAAAQFAAVHGTPGIQAILCPDSAQMHVPANEGTLKASINTMRSKATQNSIIPGNLMFSKQSQLKGQDKGILSNMSAHVLGGQQQTFAAVMNAMSKHAWTEEEDFLLSTFKSKYASMDILGRELASFNILQFQDNKDAILEVLKEFTK